jgi:cell fate (sporulation/competence/biofilm development) regulator YmcA (YheA/YmcA/DUF963 family)
MSRATGVQIGLKERTCVKSFFPIEISMIRDNRIRQQTKTRKNEAVMSAHMQREDALRALESPLHSIKVGSFIGPIPDGSALLVW